MRPARIAGAALLALLALAAPGGAWPLAGVFVPPGQPVGPLAGAALERVAACARLVGYLRWFHPSDQAVGASWDAFAAEALAEAERGPDQAAWLPRAPRAWRPSRRSGPASSTSTRAWIATAGPARWGQRCPRPPGPRALTRCTRRCAGWRPARATARSASAPAACRPRPCRRLPSPGPRAGCWTRPSAAVRGA